MEIKYTLRPTGIRTNARFRGPTESEKYTNFVGEAAHDLDLLGRIIDRDTFIFSEAKGQTNFIIDNMAAYYSGENVPVTSNVPTSAWMYTVLGPTGLSSNLLTWNPYDLASITQTTNGVYRMVIDEGPSAKARQGVDIVFNVVEGDIIHIRLHAKKVSGDISSFGIGSSNVNQGEGSFGIFQVSTDGRYIDHFIECKHKEMISLCIYPKHNAGTGTVDVTDVQVNYASIDKMNMQPTNTTVKRRINVLEDEIMNIINNM